MSELETRIANDLTTAQRAGVADEVATLRMLKAAVQNEAIAKREVGALDESQITAVLRRELKKRQDAAKLYEQGQRPELAAKESAEAEIIKRYLPAAPSEADVRAAVERLKNELSLQGPQAIGPLTKAVLANFQGAADGQLVSTLVRQALTNTN